MLNLDPNRRDDLYRCLAGEEDPDTLLWLSDPRNLLKAELYVAERLARVGGKRKHYDTHAVELYLDEDLERLTEALYTYQYRPSRGTAHIIWNPVQREIFAAPYIDRIVHHYIVDTINPWWDPRLCYGASSCRVGRGTSFGVKLLDTHIRRASHNYAVRVYVVKLDISGYFMHIVREKLLARVLWGLERQFEGNFGKRYRIMKHALTAVIMDNPIDGVRIQGSYNDWRKLPVDKSLFWAAPGCGIVIGNVTSQVFSNIYLDPLDKFITGELGWKYYGRYVDDFYIVVTEEQLVQVKRDIRLINGFLHGLGLSLNQKKTRIIPSWQGVPFLGVRVGHDKIVPDRRLTRNFANSVRTYIAGVNSAESVISYLGLMKNYDARKLTYRMFRGNDGVFNEFRKIFPGVFGEVEY